MTPDHFRKLQTERIFLCPIQARSQICRREASFSDKLPRVNLLGNKGFFYHSKNTCDFYNHRGYIIVVKNWESDGNFVSWEFHSPSALLQDSWIRTLKATRTLSQEAEDANKLFFREMIKKLQNTVETRDRFYLMRTYKKCFIGSEFVESICDELKCTTKEALKIGNDMMSFGLLTHVKHEHELINDFFFYNFCENNIAHLVSKSTNTSTSTSSENLLDSVEHNRNSIHSSNSVSNNNLYYNTIYTNTINDDHNDNGNQIEFMEGNKEIFKNSNSIFMATWKSVPSLSQIFSEKAASNKSNKTKENNCANIKEKKFKNDYESDKSNYDNLNKTINCSKSISFLSFSYYKW